MIGTNLVRTQSLVPIYQHIFPALIRLASDVDQISRQLFEPLVMQIIHWFTKNRVAENEETMTLLGSFPGHGSLQVSTSHVRSKFKSRQIQVLIPLRCHHGLCRR